MTVVGLGFESVVGGCWRSWVCCGGAAAAGSVVLGYLIWVCCNFLLLVLGDFGMGLLGFCYVLFWVWILVDFGIDRFSGFW